MAQSRPGSVRSTASCLGNQRSARFGSPPASSVESFRSSLVAGASTSEIGSLGSTSTVQWMSHHFIRDIPLGVMAFQCFSDSTSNLFSLNVLICFNAPN